MISLSPRVTEAIKPALAIAIIYAISFYMGWHRPYWAAVSAASVNLLSQGMTIHRGVIRTLSTLGGGLTAMVIIGMFPQERWAYMIAGTIPLFIWGYGCAGEKEDYLWVVAGITFMVIMAVALSIPDSTSGTVFDIVATRVTQTLMGSGVMVLIAVYLWPKQSINKYERTVRKGLKIHRRLLDLYRSSALQGKDANEKAKRLRVDDARLQEEVHFALHISENDSFEMLETRHQWHHFLHLGAAQIDTLESLRENLAEVRELDLKTYLPNLGDFLAEIDRRMEQIDLMVGRKRPNYAPRAVTLAFNEADVQALSRFQQASIGLTRNHLQKLHEITRSLYNTIAEIRMFERPEQTHDADHSGHEAHHSAGPRFVIDLDQLASGFGVVTGVWASFLLWILVYDVPNGSVFWAMAGIFTLIIAYRAEMPFWDIYWGWAVGAIVAGICYVYIMQHLDGYRELGAMIFIACFLMGYALYPRPHPGARMFAVISFTIVVLADNHQIYYMPQYLHQSLWLFLVMSVAVIARSFYVPLRPEKWVLRFHDRFFQHALWLISTRGPERKPKPGLATLWKNAIYGDDISMLPGKMTWHAPMIDYRALTWLTPQQVDGLITSVFALSYRVKGLVEAAALPQAEPIEELLRNEKQDWQLEIEEWLRRQALSKDVAIPPAADLPERLKRLEARISDALEKVDEGTLQPRDYENFHRLLGSYRSLSEAATEYSRSASAIDWAVLREMRFPIGGQRGIWPVWRQGR